jgi:hypothetical protein
MFIYIQERTIIGLLYYLLDLRLDNSLGWGMNLNLIFRDS